MRYVLLVVAALVLRPQVAQAQSVTVQGIVIDGNSGNPIPGLTVSLIQPELGRSAAAATDAAGQFSLGSIPSPNDYYIEIFWGPKLIYRHDLRVADSDAPAGRLQVPAIVIR